MKHVKPSLGLHGLGQSKGFDFQLTYLTEQCDEIVENLDKLIEHTKSPNRKCDFHLGISHSKKDKRVGERILEHAIWTSFKDERNVIPGVCDVIHSYQVPLKEHQAKNGQNVGWKAIDLLGTSEKGFPVVFELKLHKKRQNESPLRMIVEAAAYGIAIHKIWGNILNECKVKELDFFKHSQKDPQVRLVGIAPQSYWERSFNSQKPGTNSSVPEGFLDSFKKLCKGLDEQRMPVSFVSIKEAQNEPTSFKLEVYDPWKSGS